jgi:SPP1 family predicted phage head-tail adaptor
MQAGKLNRRVTFLEKTATRDSDGAEIETWTPCVVVWAHVSPTTGREYVQAKQLTEEQTTRITCRYRPGITPRMRAMAADRTYDVIDVQHKDLGYRALEIMCREVREHVEG